jgi:hypothetical protein
MDEHEQLVLFAREHVGRLKNVARSAPEQIKNACGCSLGVLG